MQPLPSALDDEILGVDIQSAKAEPGGRHRYKKLCVGLMLLLALAILASLASGGVPQPVLPHGAPLDGAAFGGAPLDGVAPTPTLLAPLTVEPEATADATATNSSRRLAALTVQQPGRDGGLSAASWRRSDWNARV